MRRIRFVVHVGPHGSRPVRIAGAVVVIFALAVVLAFVGLWLAVATVALAVAALGSVAVVALRGPSATGSRRLRRRPRSSEIVDVAAVERPAAPPAAEAGHATSPPLNSDWRRS